SAYTYAYATLGELVAWIIGWDLILEYAVGAATVAAGWSGNIISLLAEFGIQVPPAIAGPPGMELILLDGRLQPLAAARARATAMFDVPAFLVIVAVTALLIVGIRESATFNAVIVAVKVGTVLAFIAIAGAFLLEHPTVARANWTPFIPPNTGEFGHFGWS